MREELELTEYLIKVAMDLTVTYQTIITLSLYREIGTCIVKSIMSYNEIYNVTLYIL